MTPTQRIDRALAAFEPIGLTDLDSVRLMNRVDTKYALSEDVLAEALESLSPHYRVLEIEGVRRSDYSTLYFDTPGRDCYRQHHNGKANRRKYRMRTYVSSGLTFFEVKTKTSHGRTVKKRVPIPAIQESLGAESIDLARSVAGAPVTLAPNLWTEFRRITLAGVDFAERVTIDTDLAFRSGGREDSLDGVAIVEVKQERATRDSPIRRRLRELRVRPMRVSKYCLGSALLDPTLKQNNFKAKLRTLQSAPSDE